MRLFLCSLCSVFFGSNHRVFLDVLAGRTLLRRCSTAFDFGTITILTDTDDPVLVAFAVIVVFVVVVSGVVAPVVTFARVSTEFRIMSTLLHIDSKTERERKTRRKNFRNEGECYLGGALAFSCRTFRGRSSTLADKDREWKLSKESRKVRWLQ